MNLRKLIILAALTVVSSHPLMTSAREPARPAPGELKTFDFPVHEAQSQQLTCAFPNLKLPKNFVIFASGAYSGRELDFQIDQSGHEATQFDIAVNNTDNPVVLILGAYEPSIWNIGWSKGTKIVAVFATGNHKQVVAGLNKETPVLISTSDNKGPCDYFYLSESSLQKLNPTARMLFGRPVDMVYPVKNGRAVIGQPLAPGARLLTASDNTPESYYDKSAPKAGPAGLQEAVEKGFLRKATRTDAEAWANALANSKPAPDIPPMAGGAKARPPVPSFHAGYVVLKPFTFPAGLYGGNSATFFIPKGVPRPQGKPGHSDIYDFNTMTCTGSSCNRE